MTTEDSAENTIWPNWSGLACPYLTNGDLRIRNAAAKFGDALRSAHPALWSGQGGLQLTASETDTVLERLEHKKPRAQRRLIQHIFRRGLSAGNANGLWKCYLPPLRHSIRHAMPLVRQADFVRVQALRLAQERLRSRLDDLPLSDAAVSAGAVLFCAASYGGLIARRWLQALCVVADDALGLSDVGVRIDLTDPKNDKKRRSFFPDPFSELLILAHRARHGGLPIVKLAAGENSATAMERCLEAFCNALELERETIREVRKNIHLLALPALFQDAPGYIVGSAIDRTVTTHLRNDTLSRILGELFSPRTSTTTDTETDSPAGPVRGRPRVVDGRRDSYLRSIQRTLSEFGQPQMRLTREDAITAVSDLRSSVGQLWPVEKLLRDWALHLLSKVGSGELAPPSVARYFQSIWQPMLAAAFDIDPHEFKSDSWEDLYDEALSLVRSEAGRRYLQRRLVDFHQWLTNEIAAPAVDFTELDHYVTGTGAVNANLITVAEFKSAIAWLDDPGHIDNAWLREVCVNVLTLCFRCGLRRRESLQVRLMDFRPISCVLWIRPSHYGSIKSVQGIRKLFLDALLEPEELERFSRWFTSISKDVANCGTSENLVFCNPERPQELLDAQRVFVKIMDAVQFVCGDETLVPHHLRHSFSNWTFVRLQIATRNLQVPRSTPAFADTCFDLGSCRRLKDRLYNLIPEKLVDAGRRDLYCITALMGHLSPITTLRSYIHLIDFLTGCYARGYPKVTRVVEIANLRGLHRTSIYNMINDVGNANANVFMLVLGDLRRRLLDDVTKARQEQSA